jgi:chromosome segregation ATPase
VRRRGAGTSITLALLLLASVGVGAYLWLTTARWQDDSAAWEVKARGYAEEVAELRAELDGVNAELVAAREQLSTATSRISDLANEKAQLGDENVASEQYLDYQTRVSEAAGVVATALGQCTQAQSQLIGYLEKPEAYDRSDLDRFAGEVSELCRQANDANEQLQQELSR